MVVVGTAAWLRRSDSSDYPRTPLESTDSEEVGELQARHDELHERLVAHEDNHSLSPSQRELAGAWRRRVRARG